jgi:uncharacterized protein YndB with AHSA1/START domain
MQEEFQGRIEVRRPPAEVFAFLADKNSMPRYLETVRRVVAEGADRVRVEGEVRGHPYRDEGWLRVEEEGRRMRWGAAGEPGGYEGELEVRGIEGGGAEVRVRLLVDPSRHPAHRLQEEAGSLGHGMRLALERALGAIKAACEAGTTTGPADKDAPRSADDLPDSRPFGGSATLNPDI